MSIRWAVNLTVWLSSTCAFCYNLHVLSVCHVCVPSVYCEHGYYAYHIRVCSATTKCVFCLSHTCVFYHMFFLLITYMCILLSCACVFWFQLTTQLYWGLIHLLTSGYFHPHFLDIQKLNLVLKHWSILKNCWIGLKLCVKLQVTLHFTVHW